MRRHYIFTKSNTGYATSFTSDCFLGARPFKFQKHLEIYSRFVICFKITFFFENPTKNKPPKKVKLKKKRLSEYQQVIDDLKKSKLCYGYSPSQNTKIKSLSHQSFATTYFYEISINVNNHKISVRHVYPVNTCSLQFHNNIIGFFFFKYL